MRPATCAPEISRPLVLMLWRRTKSGSRLMVFATQRQAVEKWPRAKRKFSGPMAAAGMSPVMSIMSSRSAAGGHWSRCRTCAATGDSSRLRLRSCG